MLVMEYHDKVHRPIYYTKSLLDAETKYLPLEKLALALMMAAKKLRTYFRMISETDYGA